MSISLIVAIDEQMTIGYRGKIPWDFVEDRKFFKKITSGHTVVMGKKTWDSLPIKHKPLSNRLNIVVTRSVTESTYQLRNLGLENIYFVPSIEDSLEFINTYSGRGFVIGGTQIYKEFLDNNLVDKLIVTHVTGRYSGDTFFPLSHENLVDDWTWNSTLLMTKDFVIIEYIKSQ